MKNSANFKTIYGKHLRLNKKARFPVYVRDGKGSMVPAVKVGELLSQEALIAHGFSKLEDLYTPTPYYPVFLEEAVRTADHEELKVQLEIFKTSRGMLGEITEELGLSLRPIEAYVNHVCGTVLTSPQLREILQSIAKRENLLRHSLATLLVCLHVYNEMKILKLDTVTEIGLAALLHDVGKLHLDEDQMQQAKDNVSQADFDDFKRHPITGEELLMGLDDIPMTAPIAVMQHHEKLDGSGYPQGLEAGDLPKLSKILIGCNWLCMKVMPAENSAKISPQEALKKQAAEDTAVMEPSLHEALKNVFGVEKKDPGPK